MDPADTTGLQTASGVIREVIYLGATNHYVVDLTTNATLTVARQNLHGASDQNLRHRADTVTLGWLPEHVIELTTKEN